jgi:hypothetical protein
VGVVNDAIAFYFENVSIAQAFVARFCCGYRLDPNAGWLALGRDVCQRAIGDKKP